MKIQQAKLCLDCDELYTGDGCPKCASRIYIHIDNWITHKLSVARIWNENKTKAIQP